MIGVIAKTPKKKLHAVDIDEDELKSSKEIEQMLKSNSTNTFSLRGFDGMPKLDSNWMNPDLLHFPKIAPQLKKERKTQRKIFKEIGEKFKLREISDASQKLKRYDVEINLQRMLYKNDRYLGLSRNISVRRPQNIFGNAFMHRVMHKGKLTANDVADDNADYPSIHSICPRYENNLKRYEDRYLREIFDTNTSGSLKLPKLGYNHQEDEMLPKIEIQARQFVSNSLNSFNIPMAQNRTSTMIDSKEEQFDNTGKIEKTYVSTSLPMLKPRNQQIAKAAIKAKPLVAQKKVIKEKTMSDDNDDENDLSNSYNNDD